MRLMIEHCLTSIDFGIILLLMCSLVCAESLCILFDNFSIQFFVGMNTDLGVNLF